MGNCCSKDNVKEKYTAVLSATVSVATKVKDAVVSTATYVVSEVTERFKGGSGRVLRRGGISCRSARGCQAHLERRDD